MSKIIVTIDHIIITEEIAQEFAEDLRNQKDIPFGEILNLLQKYKVKLYVNSIEIDSNVPGGRLNYEVNLRSGN